MTPTAWVLAALLPLALGMIVWAHLTGGPGPDWRQEEHRAPFAHGRKNRGQATQRLAPPVPADWLPPMERPGGMAQRLPDHEHVLRARERSQEL